MSKAMASNSTPNTSPTNLSKMEYYNIKALAIMRLCIGASCIFIPGPVFALCGYPLRTIELSTFARMIGARDLILGDLLYTAEDKTAADGGKREMRRALWGGMAADLFDAGVVVAAVSGGYLRKGPGSFFIGGVMVAVGQAVWGLKALR
ncbi:hypothetical protein DM02DRAFT_650992 [Periconia macrospinosa]|uniref:Uncharacterized protein n=1 Tax=Periconia macrospinosa TaxID=97972 RepID=A0A2V1E3F6_9PLEO|nr:hypothetical protein DM02DRAFT_650992 [Periconia macrospinosa]